MKKIRKIAAAKPRRSFVDMSLPAAEKKLLRLRIELDDMENAIKFKNKQKEIAYQNIKIGRQETEDRLKEFRNENGATIEFYKNRIKFLKEDLSQIGFIENIFDGNKKKIILEKISGLEMKLNDIMEKSYVIKNKFYEFERLENAQIRGVDDEIVEVVKKFRKTESILNGLLSDLPIIRERHAKKNSENLAIEKIKAMADANKESKRKTAGRIKPKLEKTIFCPYCDNKITAQPHADHIIPISNGGLSTVENMVYICNECNSLKSSLTLREFCQKFNRDRNKIELKLLEMGKRV